MRLLALAIVTCALALSQGTTAKALPLTDSGLKAPSLVEQAACRTIRERVVRPSGRVVYRTVRRCSPRFHRDFRRCRVITKRIVRPNGRVVHERVRRCR